MIAMRRPVYVVQCRTFKRALEILGIPVPEKDRGLATPRNHPIVTFRALPGYRDQFGQQLRDKVAASFRMERHTHYVDNQGLCHTCGKPMVQS